MGRTPYACVECKRWMMLDKTGVYVLEISEDGTPYKVWHADRWICHGCNTRIIGGFGRGPLAERHETEMKIETWLPLVTHTIRGCPSRKARKGET